MLDVAYEPRTAGEFLLALRVRLTKLAIDEKSSLRDRWEDWLTAHQEKYSQKWPWLYSVHPSLAKRKSDKQKLAEEKEKEIQDLVKQINEARNVRISEFLTKYGAQKD